MTTAQAPPPKVKRPAASGIAAGPLAETRGHLNSATTAWGSASGDAERHSGAERSDRVSTLQAQYALIGWALYVRGGALVAARHGLTRDLPTLDGAEQFLALIAENALADVAADRLDQERGDCMPKEYTCSAQ